MPTKNFFSGSDSGRENTRGNREPQEQDDPFAGMQKLNFDFFDEGTDGAEDADGASPFDALFDELPQEQPRAAKPASGSGAPGTEAAGNSAAAPAPFIFESQPSGAGTAEPPKAAPAQRPAQTDTGASRSWTPTRRQTQPSFDLSALEKEIDRQSLTSRPEATEGYAPLSFDFDPEDRPARAAQPSVAVSQPTAAPSAPAASAPRPSSAPVSAPSAAPAAAQTAAPRPAAPSAPAARRPAAPAQAASAQNGGLAPGQGVPRPASRSADYSTISFSLGDVSVEAPTMAFMPIEQINSAASAQAEANRRAAEKNAPVSQPAQSADARAARMAKERNIGAAVFSALMEQDAAPTPTARTASSGGASRASAATMEWPAAPRAGAGTSRAPKPINWRAQNGTTGAAGAAGAAGTVGTGAAGTEAPQPDSPFDMQIESPKTPAPQPPSVEPDDDGLTPLDFNFDDIDSFDLPKDTPSRNQQRGAELLDLYGSDPDEQPPRRPRSGRSSGSGGGRSPRKSSESGTGKVPAKTIFAWCGILLIAVLVILLFVVFGDKDESTSSSSGSASASASTSDVLPSESMPVEPVVTPIPRDEWYMVLANRNSVLPSDYAVEQTETVGEALVDARIAESLRQMVNDAAAAGIRLKPTNGYRTVARQQELWNARVQKLMTENGLSQADAEVRALDYTSRPGTSDHNTGLGLDIVSEDHPGKDAAFADTAASAWLAEHAAEYGFIQRYPSDKTAETGMDFEPYHYRYVGVEQAQLIKASGLCLEEYLAQ